MQQNVGNADKVARTVIGLALLSLIVLLEGNARWWGLIGLVLLFTVVTGWCPAYSLVGVNTRKGEK